MARAKMLKAVLPSLFLLSATLSGGCATFPAGSGGTLQEEIDEILSSPPLDQVNWGIRIVDPERGQILYSRHPHLKFIPASNMKILSAATALSLMGPEYRYQTDIYGVGAFDEGGRVLDGDLLLTATGDPTLSDRFYPSAEAPLDSLAEGLWTAGIRTVTGSLVVDASTWDSTSVPGTWEVGDLSTAYASTGGAFSIAEGTLTLEVTAADQEGSPAQARWWPYLDDEFITVSFATVHPDSSTRGRVISYLPESRRLQIQGKVGAGVVDTLRFSQRDPVRIASSALFQALERRGIQVEGGVQIVWDSGESVGPGSCPTGWWATDDWKSGAASEGCPEAIRIAGLTSPRMAEIVKGLLEPSQNWMAEQLVRSLGAELGQEGSWREGFLIEHEFLTQEVGVDSLDLTLLDGSGLSAKSLVTPRAVVRILEYMRASSNSGAFRNALASPGEEEGTLLNRLPGLESRVFAKTGSMLHVNALSGYVFTESGRELIFSILTNGSGLPSGVVRAAIDKVVEVAARH